MRRTSAVTVATLVAGVVLGACSSSGGGGSGPTVVSASNFDQSCTTDNDCVPAYSGNVCGLCLGYNDAVSTSGETAYQAALSSVQKNCPPQRVNGSCGIEGYATSCGANGKCELTDCPGPMNTTDPHHCPSDAGADGGDGGSTVVSAGGFSTACKTDDDCVVVSFGDVCGFCPATPDAAIASSADAAYQAAYNAARANCPVQMGNGSCAEASSAISTCSNGVCEVQTCSGPAPAPNPHQCPSDAGTDGG
jgi:hypothetical protein